jgi:hypothetical protein
MSSRASELVNLSGNPWTALQFDNAVTLVGTVIEGAAQEMEKVGSDDKPEWKPRYTMKQLLDPDFRLPVNGTADNQESDFDDFVDFFEGKNIQGLKYDKA